MFRDRDNQDNKVRLIILAVALLILLCLLTVLYLVFRPVEGEEEIFAEYNTTGGGFKNYAYKIFSKSEFKEFQKATEEEIADYEAKVVNAAVGEYVSPTNMNLYKAGSGNFDDVNEAIYAIAAKATEQSALKSLPKQFFTPSVILAQAITETGNTTTASKILVPAIPAKYMKDSEITVEKLKTFNTADVFRLGSAYRSAVRSNVNYQGPLQNSLYYGVSSKVAYSDEGVIYKSEKHNIEANDDVMRDFGSKAWSISYVRSTNGAKKVGDRHNWNDASILSAQYWDYGYSKALKMSDKRTEKIRSSEALVAYIGLNHNIGESVSYSSLTRDRSKMCNGSCNYGDLWNYIDWFNSPEAQSAIRDVANKAFQNYKSTGQITHISKAQTASIWKNSNGGNSSVAKLINEQATDHAMRIVYWYYVAEIFYKNGGESI